MNPLTRALGSTLVLVSSLSLVLDGELRPAGAQTVESPTTLLPQSPSGLGHALLRVAHMAGNGTPLRVMVNGKELSASLPVGQKTEYLQVQQRLVDVELLSPNQKSQTVAVRQLGKGVHATVYPRPFGTRPGAILVNDSIPEVPDGNAAIRFVHLSEKSGDLTVTADGRATVVDRLRSTDFQLVSAGPQVMSVKPQDSPGTETALLEFQFDGAEQGALTFVLSDGVAGLAVAVIDEGQSRRDSLAVGPSLTSRNQFQSKYPATKDTLPRGSDEAVAVSTSNPTDLPNELALTLEELNGSPKIPMSGPIFVLSVAGVALALGDRRRRRRNIGV